jgi:hypothetical protein
VPGSATLRDDALAYAVRGWSVIPVRGKQPAFAWKCYQAKPPADSLLRDWFSRRFDGITGIAVIAGPVSGGLTCRDYDQADGYHRWAKDHPDLARVLPTVQTGRGFHVYFQSEAERIRKLGDGELRGSGYSLLPPSRHPSGAVYCWAVPLRDEPLPILDPRTAGLLLCNTEDTESAEDTPTSLEFSAPSVFQAQPCADAVEAAILATLPTGEGQRHRAVFALARRLKALPHLTDADALDLKPVVRRWHQLALPAIRTKPFEETWLDFVDGWRRVKFPAGAGPVEALWSRALAEPLPAAALAYEQDGVRLLVGLCGQLQRHAGRGTFFLACRTAGALLGVPHTTGWRWLRLLEIDGILRRISTGSKASGKANEYRYLED